MKFASQFLVGKALADCSGDNHLEAVTVIDWHFASPAIVEAEGLFVKVTEKIKRLNRNISPVNRAVNQTPEIIHAVRMHLTAHVFNRMNRQFDERILTQGHRKTAEHPSTGANRLRRGP